MKDGAWPKAFSRTLNTPQTCDFSSRLQTSSVYVCFSGFLSQMLCVCSPGSRVRVAEGADIDELAVRLCFGQQARKLAITSGGSVYRTRAAGSLSADDIGSTVTLSG